MAALDCPFSAGGLTSSILPSSIAHSWLSHSKECFSVSVDIVDSWFRAYMEIDDTSVVHVDLNPRKELEACACGRQDKQEKYRWHRFRFDRPGREFAAASDREPDLATEGQ